LNCFAKIVLLLIATWLPTTASADEVEDGANLSLDEVLACMSANSPQEALVQVVELVTVDRTGSERTQTGKLAVKRFPDGGRMLLRIEAPPDLRGTAFLLIQKEDRSDMFTYLPALQKVRRITSQSLRGRLLGTDFTYEEIEQMLAMSRANHPVLEGPGSAAGRPTWTLRTTPSPDSGSSYSKIVTQVDQETCIPIVIDFYEAGAEPAKTLTADPDRITQEVGGVHVARLLEMEDRKRGTRSRIVTHSVEIDPELRDRDFTQSRLARGR
jgi:hypothetical protein